MEEPFLQHICSDDLKTREDEVSEFINCVLGAFSNPVDSDCWNRVCGALQALEDCSSRKELRGRRDLLHYLNRLSVFLLSEGKQVQRREELLQILQPLMDSVSIRQGSLEIPPSSNALASMDILTSDNYNPLEQNAEFKFSLLSTHGKHKDDLFLFDPSSLPSYSPHPPPPSIADLRSSLPAVLSQVVRLQRGKRGGLGITELPLDLHLSSSLPLTAHQAPEQRAAKSVTPPARPQLLPLPHGLKKKSLTKIQTKSPRTGEEVIKYFACGGENRFFYLKLDPTSPCYDPYKLVIFSESAPQPPAPPPSKEFYTISAFGVVRHFPDGTTESSSLVAWQREATLFRGLKMLPFFGRFSLLKAIRRWKRVTALIRQEKVREFLQENLLLQVPCFLPLLNSASQWPPRLAGVELFPRSPAVLLSIECVDGRIREFRRRALSEVKQLYAQGSEQLEQLCCSLRQELSFCEQSIELEDGRAAGSKALPLSTQSRALRRLMQQRARVLTAVRLIPRLSSFLDFSLHSALKQFALAAAASYLSYLSISQEDASPSISLAVNVVRENGVFVMDCLVKRSDLYDVLLAPFSDHYHELEKIDRPLLSETTNNELKKASEAEEEKPTSRTCKLSFVRQVVAHSILTEKQNASGEKRSFTHQTREYQGESIRKKRIQNILKCKLLEVTKNEELTLLAVLRKANAEISTKLDFLKWMLEMVAFIQVWGGQEYTDSKLCFGDLNCLYENISIWSERMESVPEVWSIDKQLFQLDLSEMKSSLRNRLEVAAENLFQVSFNQYCDCYNRFMESIQENIQTISQIQLDTDNFVQFTQMFTQMKEDKNGMLLLKKELDEMYELLQSSTVVQVEDLEEKHAVIIPKWYKYLTYLQSISSFISEEQGNVVSELRRDFSQLERLALDLVQEANTGSLTQWIEQPQDNRDSVERIEKEFIHLRLKMKESECQLLALVEEGEAASLSSQFEGVVKLQAKITTRKQLWDSVAIGQIKISEWYNIPFGQLKMSEINTKLNQWSDQLAEIEQTISPQEEVIMEWKNKLETFKSNLASLNLLADPGMKSHFWHVLFTALGLTFPSNDRPTNISSLITQNILNYPELINRIHASAMVEGRLEEILSTVIQTWKCKEYKLVKHTAAPFQGMGTERQDDSLMYLSQQQGFTSYVLQDEEELYSLINHNSTQLQIIVESQCTQSLKKSARIWIDILQQLAEFISVWMDCQAKWIYLSSIFVEFDVLGTHTSEVGNFKQLNASYQSVVSNIFDHKNVMSLICVKVGNVLQLKEEQDVLKGRLFIYQREFSEMMKPMKEMFEDTRNVFARAFYLSEPQILDLYVHTGNPKALLPHLRLCFPGVHNVLWETEVSTHKLTTVEDVNKLGLKITGVFDVYGNIFKLKSPLVTGHQPGHFWLNGLDRALRVSISYTIHRILSYVNLSNLLPPSDNPLAALLSSWHDHSLQCLSVALSLAWSHVVESSIDDENRHLLSQLNLKLSQCASNLIDEFTPKLDVKKRCILSNILLRVHNLQQSLSILIREFPISHDSFLWATHFKYKYTVPPDSEFDQLVPIISINHLNYRYPYCNEYQGCTQEIVLTPLTEKCIFNLCLAMYTNQLAGIIGTHSADNSEVVKHLCGTMGRACFALDASSFRNHAQVTTAMLGFIQSGTVGYLVNLDKLKTSLSCTLATLLQAIKRETDKRLPYRAFLYFYDITPATSDNESIDWYSLEEFGVLAKLELGREINLMHGYGCCVSISDHNLPKEFSNYLHTKVHYFYLSQPNCKSVLEAILLSSNFSAHQVISSKIITFFNHLQNLIDKQMFSLSTSASQLVTEAAHCMEVTESLWNEEKSREKREILAVYSAVWRFVKPHISKGEEISAKSILNSVFPECASCVGILSQMDMQNEEFNKLEGILNRILLERQYRHNTKQLERIFDIYNSLNRRENVILYGPTLSGKTTSLQLLSHALIELHEESGPSDSKYIHLTSIFPQAVDISTLYGWYDDTRQSWRQGLLHKLLSNSLYSVRGCEYWFLFDGKLDGDWALQIPYLLNNKQFTGCDESTLQLPETCRFIFETDLLHYATPAFLSQCCPISMGGGIMSWRDLLEHWLQSLTVWQGIAENDVLQLRTYSKQAVPALLDYLHSQMSSRDTAAPADRVLEMIYVRNFTRLMSAMLKKSYVSSCKRASTANISQDGIAPKNLNLSFTFSIAWGFGGSLDREGRSRFSRYMLDVLQQNNITTGLRLEQGGTIFDYFINPSLSKLVPWRDMLTDRSSYSGYVNLPEFDKFSVLGELLLNDGVPLFFSGPVGAGKTGMVENLLRHRVNLSSLSYSPLWTPSRMQQRIRTSTRTHQKRSLNLIPSLDWEDKCALFIDDFSFPSGATGSGCEDVLRQLICTSSVYDSATKVMKPVSMVLLIAATFEKSMLSASSSKHNRFLSQFFHLTIDHPQRETLVKIFGPPTTKWLFSHLPYSETGGLAKDLAHILVETSVAVFQCVRERLIASPLTPHYTFTLFELNKLFQSLLLFTSKHTDKDRSNASASFSPFTGFRPKIKASSRQKLFRHGTMDVIKSSFQREKEINYAIFYKTLRQIVRFWCHEHSRVYSDKLNCEKDQEWFLKLLIMCVRTAFCDVGSTIRETQSKTRTKSKANRMYVKKEKPLETNEIIDRLYEEVTAEKYRRMKVPFSKIFALIEEVNSLMFLRRNITIPPSVLMTHTSTDLTELNRNKNMYMEVTDFGLKTLLQPHLDMLNSQLRPEDHIILYPFALEHIVRIARVLQTPESHLLFAAERKLGRITLVRLAAGLTQCRMFEMQGRRERDGLTHSTPLLQEAISAAVTSRSHVVVIVSGDWQPEVLYAIEELLSLEIVNPESERMLREGEEGTSASNYHRVSPIPDIFKHELLPPRYPPKLTKNILKHNLHFVFLTSSSPTCLAQLFARHHTLAKLLSPYFLCPLCELSLREVAQAWLGEHAVGRWVDEKLSLDRIGEVAAHIHCTAFERAADLFPDPRHWAYKSSIRMFVDFLKTSGKMAYVIARKEAGLTKEVKKAQTNMRAARGELEVMRRELGKLDQKKQAKLREIGRFEEGMSVVRRQYRNAEQVSRQQAEEIEICKSRIEGIERELERQFGEVDPLYEIAQEAIRTLKKEDVVEIASFLNPPEGVKRITDSVCRLFGREASWSSALELFKSKHFFRNLLYYDKEKNMKAILSCLPEGFLCTEEEVRSIAKCSKAAESVARWLIAIFGYARVDKETRAQKRVAAQLGEEVQRLEEERGRERMQMNSSMTQLDSDNLALQEMRNEVDTLDEGVDVISSRIEDASRIFSSLQLVEAKFNTFIRKSEERVCSLGNALITAGAINYLTPFPSSAICDMVIRWRDFCGTVDEEGESELWPCTQATRDFSLLDVIASEEELFYWESKKELPQGEGYKLKLLLIRAVASFDRLWPYVYDPTGMFYKWMKNLETAFRGVEVESLFSLTKGYEDSIRMSVSLPEVQKLTANQLDSARPHTPPSSSPNAPHKGSETAAPLRSGVEPSPRSKKLTAVSSWNKLRMKSRLIFSPTIRLTRSYEEEFESILETEMSKSSPVPVIALSMSCLPRHTSREVIYSQFQERETGRCCQLGGKEVEVSSGFRLYLVSNHDPLASAVDAPEVEIERVRLCCFRPSREGLREILFSLLAEAEMGEVCAKRETASRDVVYFYKLMKEKRKKLLEHIIDSPSIASDLELIQLISSTARELERAEEGRAEYQEACDRLQEELEGLRVVSDSLELVWLGVSRMEGICRGEREYNFTLSGFLDTVQRVVSRTVRDTFRPVDGAMGGRVHQLRALMQTEMYSHYLSQLVEVDKPVFLLSTIFSAKLSQDEISQEEWDSFFLPEYSTANCIELLNSLFSDFDEKRPAFLSPEVWAQVSQRLLPPGRIERSVDSLFPLSPEWEEYFSCCQDRMLDQEPASADVAMTPEHVLLLWRETQPREFMRVLQHFLLHRVGTDLERMPQLSFCQALQLAADKKPLLIYTDSDGAVGDCLEFVRSQVTAAGDPCKTFDLSCKASLQSLSSYISDFSEVSETILLINCELVSCWPTSLQSFLHVSYLCRFRDATRARPKHLIVITRSSAMHRLPLSIKSSPVKLAYNHRYFTPSERVGMYGPAVSTALSRELHLDSCSLPMKINAVLNSGAMYDMTSREERLTHHINFLTSITYFLHEFFQCNRSLSEDESFLAHIFPGLYSPSMVGRDQLSAETPVFNRIWPGSLPEAKRNEKKMSLLLREMACGEASLQLEQLFFSRVEGRRKVGEADLSPLLELLDLLIADVITLLNKSKSLQQAMMRSLQIGALQDVLKRELRGIEDLLRMNLEALEEIKRFPKRSIHKFGMQELQFVWQGYMPVGRDGRACNEENKLVISLFLVWNKEALEYYRRHLEGSCSLLLRYHQYPLAWITACLWQQAKSSLRQLERCKPVVKIVGRKEGRADLEEDLIGTVHNVSLSGVLWHDTSHSFSLHPSQSCEHQNISMHCVQMDSSQSTYATASLYSLDLTQRPVFFCDVYIPLTRSERNFASGNPIIFLQK